jgi:hypothetical protein
MIKLVIKGWSEERAWLGSDSWSQLDYCQRLYNCTYLRGAALDRAAHLLAYRERCELELISRERAEALIYTLDTCGALFEVKPIQPDSVIFIDRYRKAVRYSKTVTKLTAEVR